jgi:hypothetical protein
MRAKDFIIESAIAGLQPEVSAALPATFVIPALPNQDPYRQYRFGVALAGAGGAKQRAADGISSYSAESIWGESEIVVCYDPSIEKIIDEALGELGLPPSSKRLTNTRKSEEADTISTSSPVKGFKGYPR